MILLRADRATAAPLARLLEWGLSLLLGISVLLTPAMPAEHTAAYAWGLPGRVGRAQPPARPSGPADAARSGSPQGALQEVAAPAAVQQLQQAMAARQPRLAILEPADGSLLPAGPWVLRLQVDDWPLVDAGPLGLGPHLLVQIDEGPAIPLVQSRLELPELSPGSHRITVMAARPWGEVVKHPGAYAQIRVHRVSPNPLSLPAPGTPQLLSTAPLDTSPAEPVLLDWLLLDAPLQHLRADDARWRLRVSVNGDSFLVDQATPLWLRGWRRGSNALLLELVDGRGEPLNPPFNSLVREVVVDGSAPRPAWRQGKLSEQDLARLLGQAPAEAATATQTGDPEPQPEPEAQAEGEVETEMAMEAGDAARPSAAATGAGATPQAGRGGERAASPPPAATASPAAPTPLASDLQTGAGTGSDEPGKPDSAQAAPAPASFPVGNGRAAALPGGEVPAAAPSRNLPEVAGAADPEAAAAAAAAPQDATAAGADPPAAASGGVPIALPTAAPGPAGPQAATGDPDPPAPVSGLPPGPSAREEVNPDGTLIRPAQGGPLQALRARLQR